MKKLLILLCLVNIIATTFSQISETGLASFYDDKFQGRVTASGELFDQNLLTAAHRTLPFGTMVRVTNLENKKTTEVRINDRGPFVNNRVIDLSSATAKALGFYAKGTAKVKIEVITLGNNNLAATEKEVEKKTAFNVEPKEDPKITTSKETLPATPNDNSSKSTIANEALEYYQLESALVEPKGFAIQIASYQEAANLMKLCNDLKTKVSANLLVQVSGNQDKKLYRVMVGPFDTRQKAEAMHQKLEKQFPGCFIVGF